MKRILSVVIALVVTVSFAHAGLTPAEQKKKKQISYALENGILSIFDIPAEKYIKYELFEQLDVAMSGAFTSEGIVYGVLSGHKAEISSVVIIGKSIVSGSDDNSIKVWDLDSGKLLRTLTGHRDDVNSVAVSEGRIISGSDDNTVKIWDLASGKLLKTLTGHKGDVNSVTVYEGKILSGSDDKTIKLWDLVSGKLLNTLKGQKEEVWSVAVSNGKIVSGSCYREIKIWDFKSGKLLNTMFAASGRNISVAVGAGKIASGSGYNGDDTIEIWDLMTGKLLTTLIGHKGDVNTLAINDGKVISGSDDKTIKIWDMKSRELIDTLTGHVKRVCSIAISGDKIVSSSSDKYIRVSALDYPNREKFKDETSDYFGNNIFTGDSYNQVQDVVKKYPKVTNYIRFAKRHAEHALSKYRLKIRKSIKNGKIGERYVPYTSSSYTSYNHDYMMINGEAINYSTNKKHSSSSGGHEETVYGYKAVYEVKNGSNKHYLIEMKSDWTGSYSKYITGTHGSWSDKSGSYSQLKTKKSASSYPKSFVLEPGEKFKYQFELGETEPTDLLTVPIKVTVIEERLYDGLITSMDKKNTDTNLIDRYLKNSMVSEWHPQLKRNRARIVKDREDRFSKENIEDVKVTLDYNKKDYDPDFENVVTVVITSKEPLKVKYESPFGTKTVAVTKKGSGYFSDYEKRVKHTVEGVKKKKLKVKVAYVWPAK